MNREACTHTHTESAIYTRRETDTSEKETIQQHTLARCTKLYHVRGGGLMIRECMQVDGHPQYTPEIASLVHHIVCGQCAWENHACVSRLSIRSTAPCTHPSDPNHRAIENHACMHAMQTTHHACCDGSRANCPPWTSHCGGGKTWMDICLAPPPLGDVAAGMPIERFQRKCRRRNV